MSNIRDIPGHGRMQTNVPSAAPQIGQAAQPRSFSPAAAQPQGEDLVKVARHILKARIRCAKDFPLSMFWDSAWDMMLELFINGEERKPVCVKQLWAASGESSTGTMRRLDRLERAALVQRRPDTQDHRRVLVSLTENGRNSMIAMLRHISDLQSPDPAPREGPVSFIPRSAS